eukprot:63281-Alexandrium_andersonii.AAC.1
MAATRTIRSPRGSTRILPLTCRSFASTGRASRSSCPSMRVSSARCSRSSPPSRLPHARQRKSC